MDTLTYPRTFAVDGAVRLYVEAGSGPVLVEGVEVPDGESPTCTVDLRPEGTDDRAGEDLLAATRVELRGDVLEVAVPRRGSGLMRRTSGVAVRVAVPAGSDVEVSARSGDVRATGRLAEVTAECGSGQIAVENATMAVATAGSGDVALGDVGAGKLRTGSGAVRVDRVRGDLDVRAGSGDITVGSVGGEVTVAAASGDVEVREALASTRITTASGDATVHRAVEGELEIRTASGDIALAVAEGTAVFLDCSSVSGRVRSALEPTDAPAPDARQLVVHARTVSGDLDVRRA